MLVKDIRKFNYIHLLVTFISTIVYQSDTKREIRLEERNTNEDQVFRYQIKIHLTSHS